MGGPIGGKAHHNLGREPANSWAIPYNISDHLFLSFYKSTVAMTTQYFVAFGTAVLLINFANTGSMSIMT